jgi:hypothetical protein
MARVTAIFDDRVQAEEAIDDLRRRGVSDAHLSILTRRIDEVEVEKARPAASAGERVAKGAITGVGVGTLFGLAAVLIPGVGPFIAAGSLASALGTTAGAAAAGAIVGGTSGALAGAMSKADYSKEEAAFFGPLVERGGILVTVETDDVSKERLRTELMQHGGRTFGSSPRATVVDVRPS